jgi:tight adherence protein B
MKRIAIAAVISLAMWMIFQSLVLSACSALAAVAMSVELENRRASKLQQLVKRNWAEVLDSLNSAASAGLNPSEAIADLAEIGPSELRGQFAEASRELDSGAPLQSVLSRLKTQLKDAHADRTLELLGLTQLLGGRGYLEAIQSFSSQIREQQTLDGELAAKQGWIKGTAKLAVASPWIIVLLLSARPENASTYNSTGGILILACGLAVCLIAYRLIHIFGKQNSWPRVFTL